MNKLLMVGLPLILVAGGGATVGLNFIGILDVPLLPKKNMPKPPPDDGKGGPFNRYFLMASAAGRMVEQEAVRAKASLPPAPPKPAPDTGPGEAKLAALWGEMPIDRLTAVVQKWPEAQLGRVLSKMDEEVVAKLLGALPAPRAATLSRVIAVATDASASKVHQPDEK